MAGFARPGGPLPMPVTARTSSPLVRVVPLAVIALLGLGGKCSREHRESIEKMNEGVTYAQHDMLMQAVTSLRQAIALEPDNIEAHHNLAIVYMKQENWRLASQELSSAISLNGGIASYHHQLGEI